MELFLEQLSLLRNPSAATYAYAFELLERLEEALQVAYLPELILGLYWDNGK